MSLYTYRLLQEYSKGSGIFLRMRLEGCWKEAFTQGLASAERAAGAWTSSITIPTTRLSTSNLTHPIFVLATVYSLFLDFL
jgi:hypothetical protein